MPFVPPNKHHWTKKEISFIRRNFFKLTNRQLAEALGLKLTSVRTKCYELGLKRMEMEYWTKAQVAYLVKNYTRYGDKELAEIFNRKWKKNKGWTKKHMDKKRKYLNLKRTPEQLRAIKDREIKKGTYLEGLKKTWQKRGVAPEGDIRYWQQKGRAVKFPVIKVEGRFVHWVRYAWEQHYGPVPKGMNVIFKDRNPYNLDINNLMLLSDGDLAKHNSKIASAGLSDNYVASMLTLGRPELREAVKQHPELLELKRQTILAKRKLNQYESKI